MSIEEIMKECGVVESADQKKCLGFILEKAAHNWGMTATELEYYIRQWNKENIFPKEFNRLLNE